MGYTYRELLKLFDNTVNLWKLGGYDEVSRSFNRHELVLGESSITIELVDKSLVLSDDVTVYGKEIIVRKKFAGVSTYTVSAGSYYSNASSYYFVTDPYEAARSERLHIKRHLDYWNRRSKIVKLNIGKLSVHLKSYLRSLIDSRLPNHRSRNYKIADAYFSYFSTNRRLTIVIKHDDCSATESFYFNFNTQSQA